MKGFIFSVCVIFVILILVILNSLYTLNATNALIDKISLLDSDNYIIMKEVLNYWDKNAPILCLSSSTKETDKIEDMLAAIESMYKTGEFLGLEEKKALIINYIELIKTHEKITLENIL